MSNKKVLTLCVDGRLYRTCEISRSFVDAELYIELDQFAICNPPLPLSN